MNQLVSICIPTLNGDRFLDQTLNSINNQTYRNFEVIISDDNSSDNTLALIAKFQKEAEFPVFIYKHLPSGIGANWNNCLKKANGEFIKFLFQDDVLFPTCIEKLVSTLQQHEDVGLVSCKRKFLLEEIPNEYIKAWLKKYKNLQAGVEQHDDKITYLSKNLFKSTQFFEGPPNKIGEPSAVLFRKTVIQNIGFFKEDLQQILDYEFYYRILKHYKIAIYNEELIGFRIHSQQATNINRNRKINDYEKYDKILYDEFFWYLNYTQKKRLLSKFNKTYMLSEKIINAAKRKF